ncbi:hypothetical protein ACQ86I_04475 [Prescottella equi]
MLDETGIALRVVAELPGGAHGHVDPDAFAGELGDIGRRQRPHVNPVSALVRKNWAAASVMSAGAESGMMRMTVSGCGPARRIAEARDWSDSMSAQCASSTTRTVVPSRSPRSARAAST